MYRGKSLGFLHLKHYLDYLLMLFREAVAQHAPAKTLCIMYIYIGAIHSAIHSLAEILHSSMPLFKLKALFLHEKLIFPFSFFFKLTSLPAWIKRVSDLKTGKRWVPLRLIWPKLVLSSQALTRMAFVTQWQAFRMIT